MAGFGAAFDVFRTAAFLPVALADFFAAFAGAPLLDFFADAIGLLRLEVQMRSTAVYADLRLDPLALAGDLTSVGPAFSCSAACAAVSRAGGFFFPVAAAASVPCTLLRSASIRLITLARCGAGSSFGTGRCFSLASTSSFSATS